MNSTQKYTATAFALLFVIIALVLYSGGYETKFSLLAILVGICSTVWILTRPDFESKVNKTEAHIVTLEEELKKSKTAASVAVSSLHNTVTDLNAKISVLEAAIPPASPSSSPPNTNIAAEAKS